MTVKGTRMRCSVHSAWIPNQSFCKPLYCNANPVQCNMSSKPYKYWFCLNITIKFRLSQYARSGCFVENVLFVLPHPPLFGDRLSLCSPGWSVNSPISASQELWLQVPHLPLSRVFETESMPQAKLNRIRFRKIRLEQKSSQEHIFPQIKVSKRSTVFTHTKTNYPNLKTSALLIRVKHTPHVPEQTDTWWICPLLPLNHHMRLNWRKRILALGRTREQNIVNDQGSPCGSTPL